jgi:hypothetical protein
MTVARQLVEGINIGNHRAFLDAILEHLEVKNASLVASTDWNERSFHIAMTKRIKRLREDIGEPEIPSELTVDENRQFTAKSEIREFLHKATTEVFIVDPYVGVGTLDCLRDVNLPIRLLTGKNPQSIEDGFPAALATFEAEGRQIEVRRHAKLHDRHFIFNERCWLVGSSFKDAGRKAFNCIEMMDSTRAIVESADAKWREGEVFRP